MRIYAIVSSDSLVVRYTEKGDIEGLQQLFLLGQASPYTICMESEPRETHSHFSRPLLRVGKRFSYICLQSDRYRSVPKEQITNFANS
jgi:hypothetical protein